MEKPQSFRNYVINAFAQQMSHGVDLDIEPVVVAVKESESLTELAVRFAVSTVQRVGSEASAVFAGQGVGPAIRHRHIDALSDYSKTARWRRVLVKAR